MGVALVTGASVRIGRAIAVSLAQEGFDVIVHAKSNWQQLCETRDCIVQSGRKSLALLADFARDNDVQTLCQEVCRFTSTLDVLVHNAAVFPCCDFQNTSQRLYEHVMAVNVRAPFFLSQRLLPLLQQAATPHVICLLDSMVQRPYSHRTAYFLSKGALQQLTHLLAVELAPHVRVNAVALGFALVSAQFRLSQNVANAGSARQKSLKKRSLLEVNEYFERIFNAAGANAAVVRQSELMSPRLGKVQDWIPLKRTAVQQDVTAAVMFLVKHASYITGQTLTVDGGSSLVPSPAIVR